MCGKLFTAVDNFGRLSYVGGTPLFESLPKMPEETLNQIWKSAVLEMRSAFTPALQQVISKSCSLKAISAGTAEIIVDNAVTGNLIRKYAFDSLTSHLTAASGTPVRELVFVVEVRPKENRKQGVEKKEHEQKTPLFTPDNEPNGRILANLNPKYTFESFIVGKRNQVAHAAAIAVAEQPGSVYNPLYLYGGVGLGKTHLMQAIGNFVLRGDPRKRVLYISSETFMNEFVASIRGGAGKDDFKKKYRNVDVLLVDDIQFLAGKDGTQEEFFHTFNALHQTGRQIVITSDQPPVALKDLEERLTSRFSMGMVANMQLPDLETRQAILMFKCQERGITLPPDALEYIADRIDTNIRELEGALQRVVLEIHATGKLNPTLIDVKEALRSMIGEGRPTKKSSVQEWLEVVVEFYSIDTAGLLGPSRRQEVVRPRQILMYIMKYELGMTYPSIGREIGGRDHTTAMHSVEKIEKELKRSPDLFEEMQQLKEHFYARRS
jgi:chromosomal replication initiator protein